MLCFVRFLNIKIVSLARTEGNFLHRKVLIPNPIRTIRSACLMSLTGLVYLEDHVGTVDGVDVAQLAGLDDLHSQLLDADVVTDAGNFSRKSFPSTFIGF